MAIKAIIRIPDNHKRTIGEILALSNEQIQYLLKMISELKPVLDLDKIIDQLGDNEIIDNEKIHSFLKVVMHMHLARKKLGYTTENFLEQILATIQIEKIIEPPSDGDWSRIERILANILSAESLQLNADAIDVAMEHERAISSVRVLTDIRPVFKEDVTEPPAATVIGHSLIISYYDGSKEPREFHCALDTEDLRVLGTVVERALLKEKSLRSWIEEGSNGFPVLS